MDNAGLLLRRGIGWFIDLTLSSIVVLAVVYGVRWGIDHIGGFQGIQQAFDPEFAVNLVGPVAFFSFKTSVEARGRRTPGQRHMLTLPVTVDRKVGSSERPSGTRADWGGAMVRNCYILLFVIAAFGYDWVISAVVVVFAAFILVLGRHPFDILAGKRVIVAPCEMDS